MTKCPCSSDWSRSKQFQLYFFQIKNISSEREIEFQVSKVKESRLDNKTFIWGKIFVKTFSFIKEFLIDGIDFWPFSFSVDRFLSEKCIRSVILKHWGTFWCIFMMFSLILTIRTLSHLSVVCINIFKSNQSGKRNCAVYWMTEFKAQE
jgi:hypothetical protein